MDEIRLDFSIECYTFLQHFCPSPIFAEFCRVFIITSNGNLVFARSKILENEKVNWSQEDISKTKRMKNTSRMKLYAETRAVWQFSNHSNWNETFFFWLDLEDRSWNVFPNWLLVSLYSSPIHPNVGGGGFLRKLLSLPSHSGSDGGWLGGGGSDSGVEWGSGSVFSSVSSRLRVFLGPSGLLVLLNGPSSQTKIHGNHNTDRCLSSGECEFRKALKTNARIRYVEQYPVGIVYWHFVLLPTPRRSRRVRPCQRFTPGVHWPPPFRWIDCLSKRFTSCTPPPRPILGVHEATSKACSQAWPVLPTWESEWELKQPGPGDHEPWKVTKRWSVRSPTDRIRSAVDGITGSFPFRRRPPFFCRPGWWPFPTPAPFSQWTYPSHHWEKIVKLKKTDAKTK